MTRVELRSDNTAGIAPEILAAIADANHGTAMAYGGDELTTQLEARISELFEREARVFPVPSGTAANALSLSSMSPPWGAVLCHEEAHIITNEGAATSMFGGGLAMFPLPGAGSKLTPDVVEKKLKGAGWGDPHESQPSVLSLTDVTEYGAVYTPDEIGALTAVAREFGLKVHLDGARIANALATLGCSPAELTWKAGVDVLSMGAIKNGSMSADAIVSFDPDASAQLVFRSKRAGLVASKMRFQSAQLLRYLEDGLWLRLAGYANAMMAHLWDGLRELGIQAAVDPEANLVLVDLPDGVADELAAAGAEFYRMQGNRVRFMTSWATTRDEIDYFLGVLRNL